MSDTVPGDGAHPGDSKPPFGAASMQNSLSGQTGRAPVGVKICGVRTVEDALAAVAAGADSIGLNFHSPSPRFVDEAMARPILAAMPSTTTVVAVLVGATSDAIVSLHATLGIRRFQVHATELNSLAAVMLSHGLHAIPARGVRTPHDVDLLRQDAEQWAGDWPDVVPALLVDARSDDPGLHGGTGLLAPWTELARVSWPLPLILAGGLTPVNVADAIRTVRPSAVDVASGVEAAPGRKDAAKMRDFVESVRRQGMET